MNLFSTAILGLGAGAWTRAILPGQGSVSIPDQPVVTLPGGVNVGLYPEFGIPNVEIPSEGAVNIPAMGDVSLPLQGMINPSLFQLPNQGNPTLPQLPNLGSWWGPCGPTSSWGANVGRITGSLTGTPCGGIQQTWCHSTFSTQSLQMPTWANNPFPSCGIPNAFFTAQLFGGGNSFYAGFSNAFSNFRSA